MAWSRTMARGHASRGGNAVLTAIHEAQLNSVNNCVEPTCADILTRVNLPHGMVQEKH